MSFCLCVCVCVKESLCVHHRRLCLCRVKSVGRETEEPTHSFCSVLFWEQKSCEERKGEQIYLYNIYRSSNYISQQTGKYFRKSISKKRQIRGGDAGIKGGISLEVLFQSATDCVSTVVDIQEDPTVTKLPFLQVIFPSCNFSETT